MARPNHTYRAARRRAHQQMDTPPAMGHYYNNRGGQHHNGTWNRSTGGRHSHTREAARRLRQQHRSNT